MRQLWTIFLFIFFIGCRDTSFDSVKWKSDKGAQYAMLNDLVESRILINKSKEEVTTILDTLDMKQFDMKSDSWMCIIGIPGNVSATQSPVKVLDITFKNGRVTRTEIR